MLEFSGATTNESFTTDMIATPVRGWMARAIPRGRNTIKGFPRSPAAASVSVSAATPWCAGAVRNLNLHEFRSMELMNEHGIPTPRGYLVSDPEEAGSLFSRHFAAGGTDPARAFLKAQVLSGRRKTGVFDNGFRGGVHPVSTPDEAVAVAGKMLGRRFLAGDAPPGGLPCHRVLLTAGGAPLLPLRRELRVSILMDRNRQGPILVGSAAPSGGRSIADDASRGRPGAVFAEDIDAVDGLGPDRSARMAENLGLEPDTPAFDETVSILTGLYDLFSSRDCTVAEIHPLGETPSGEMVAVGTRVQIDDNASFRQAALFAGKDRTQLDPREAEASRAGIDYVGLDGSIGCLVNGAGLAMATMDLIRAGGGTVASFLDVGGGAGRDRIRTALSILDKDPRVKAVLVNVFGGLVRCGDVAAGILELSSTRGNTHKKPIIVRLRGTGCDDARAQLLAAAAGGDGVGGSVRLVDDLEEATALAVATADRIGDDDNDDDDEDRPGIESYPSEQIRHPHKRSQ